MIDLMKLEEVLLNKCIEHYENMIHPDESLDDFLNDIEDEAQRERVKKMIEEMDRSVPPLQFLRIEMLNAVRRTEHFYKKSFAKCWIYKDGELTVSEEGQELENDISSSRVYFRFAASSFYWDIERMRGFVDMSYGPKFGRGFVYDIKQDGDNLILENEQLTWVS